MILGLLARARYAEKDLRTFDSTNHNIGCHVRAATLLFEIWRLISRPKRDLAS